MQNKLSQQQYEEFVKYLIIVVPAGILAGLFFGTVIPVLISTAMVFGGLWILEKFKP